MITSGITSKNAILRPIVSAIKPNSGGPMNPNKVDKVENAATFSDEERDLIREAAANASGIEIEIPIPISKNPINASIKLFVIAIKIMPNSKQNDVVFATFNIPYRTIKRSAVNLPKV